MTLRHLFSPWLGALLIGLAQAAPEPIADVHLHFNWDQLELLSSQEAAQRMQQAGIVFGVVSSVPSHYAERLLDAAQVKTLALFSPYLDAANRWRWHKQPELLERTREALASGRYQGIGELHLQPGVGPQRDDPILDKLLKLVTEFDVPALIHTDASSHEYLVPLCQAHPQARILWAHAGGHLPAAAVGKLLAACPNVWADLSARDPWRYDSLADKNGVLPAAWRKLILAYPDRFMIGSDPVWNVRRQQRWDSADEGWDYLASLLDYHRRWLATLPPAVERKLRLENALEFFRVELAP